MKSTLKSLTVLCAVVALPNAAVFGMVSPTSYDLVVYGSSPAALTAAIEAQRHGKSAVVVSPETRIGGLTTGGLGQTDIGNKSAFGGLARQFYRDVAAYYKDPANWKYGSLKEYRPDGQCSGTADDESMRTAASSRSGRSPAASFAVRRSSTRPTRATSWQRPACRMSSDARRTPSTARRSAAFSGGSRRTTS